jgi:hypothetical protein
MIVVSMTLIFINKMFFYNNFIVISKGTIKVSKHIYHIVLILLKEKKFLFYRIGEFSH